MKKKVLAMLAGMVCTISFACISGGVDHSGSSGNVDHSGMPESPIYDSVERWNCNVYRVEAGYLGYDFMVIDTEDESDYFGDLAPKCRLIFRGSPNKTMAFISEINGVPHTENHSLKINSRGDVSFSATLYNRKTVRLPIRLKVGLIQAAFNVGRNDFFISGDGSDTDIHCYHFLPLIESWMQQKYAELLNEWRKIRNTVSDFSLVLQYQVAGESSWTTVSRTRFSDLKHQSFQWQETTDGVQISKPKYYFLNGKIDGDFPVGTTLLIRIVAESVKNAAPTDLSYPLTGWESFGEKTIWSKKMAGTTTTAHRYQSLEELWDPNYKYYDPLHYIYINGFSGGLDSLYNLDSETGDLNWCPLQWMAVTIGEGRKPE